MQANVNGVGTRDISIRREKGNQVVGTFVEQGIKWAVLSQDGGQSFHLLKHETKVWPFYAYKTALWIESGALSL